MKYTIKDLRKEFATDDKCLEYVFRMKHPEAEGYYRVSDRKCWAHKDTGHQIHPLANTIFAKSSTPLTLWFHAIFLFASSKNGVSAKELQRQLGVTYKCAWRMAHEIRKLMAQDGGRLTGIVEVDETYVGGKKKDGKRGRGTSKVPVVGAVSRGGRVKASVTKSTHGGILATHVLKNVEGGATLVTDDYQPYKWLDRHYNRKVINHSAKIYVRGSIHTNTIEGFWSQLKRSIRGTYVSVSRQHLQSYVDEFAYRYNLRHSPVPLFLQILGRATA
jgi:transposase